MNGGPKRMVHRTIWASGQVAKLSRDARLLFIGLITLGDDDGRLKGSPSLIRSQIFPYDDDVKVADVDRWLKEIVAQKLVVGYCIEDECFFYHPKWDDYQHIREDRRRESAIPAPTFEFSATTTSRQPNGNQVGAKTPLKLSKDNLSKENINKDVAFVAFWEAYPKKVGKKAAWKAWQKIQYTPELASFILEAIHKAINSEQWQKDSGRYIPHAATWLNGERWNDVLTPGRAKSTKYDKVGRTA